MERLAEMERQRRQREAEQKVSWALGCLWLFGLSNVNRIVIFNHFVVYVQLVEEEAAKRIELLVKRRVEEQLEKRREEIEQEVIKRVNAAKAVMEQEMMIELEKRREQIREEERRHEVGGTISKYPEQTNTEYQRKCNSFTTNHQHHPSYCL